jgi:small subunit ribosomal protein S19
MSRSTKKGPFVDEKLLAKTMRQKDLGRAEPIKTWARACTIVPDFVGHTYMVHNGKGFIRVFVTEEMVGHKLGEFTLTRNFRGHGENKKVTG